MYLNHFNFTELPFSIAPNPRYVYLSPQHREALAHLLYGISVGGGFVVLTGEVGTGKTTLCRCLLEQLPEDVDIALIFNPRLNARELLASICDELHIKNPGDKSSIKRLIDLLNHHLLDAHARGRRTIVLIDEAQNLSFDVLEQIRLLTNLETNETKLLQIILVGQPELKALLGKKNLRQLSQRINARFHLLPLSLGETATYINHRLAVSGVKLPVFSRLAVARIQRLSGGIPRLINLICDRALLGAYGLGKTKVSPAIVAKAAREVLPVRERPVLKIAIGVVAALTLLALGLARYADLAWVPFAFPALPGKAMDKPVWQQARILDPQDKKAQGAAVAEAAKPVPSPAAAESKPTGPQPEVPAGVAAKPAADGFEEQFADPKLTKAAAFARLFSLWGQALPAGESDGCLLARQKGLRCQGLQADAAGLLKLDLPALLELVLPDGSKRFVALVGTEGRNWLLGLGEQTLSIDPARVLPFWTGDFTLLWKPPYRVSGALKLGQSSEAVRVIRQQLNEPALAGKEAYFDPKLRQRIMRFQQEHGLSADGQIGAMTMIHLEKAASRQTGPSLSNAHD